MDYDYKGGWEKEFCDFFGRYVLVGGDCTVPGHIGCGMPYYLVK